MLISFKNHQTNTTFTDTDNTKMVAKSIDIMDNTPEKGAEAGETSDEDVSSRQPSIPATREPERGEKEDNQDVTEQEVDISVIHTNDSVEIKLSLPHEILFVGVICLSQFLTRK
jgi:hypothetical protein